jgi:hypothetical protein
MDKKEVLQQIIDVIEADFENIGFRLKNNNIFEKKEQDYIYHYQIDIAKSKGGFSLHLRLMLLNKRITAPINKIMKKVLSDSRIIYPSNWSQKDIDYSIKTRTNDKYVAMLTDWRQLKPTNQSLEDFNNEFSIWFYSFTKIEEKKDWKNQLLISIDLAKKWFMLISEDNYLIDNTDLPALYLLKERNDMEKLKEKYNSILLRMQKLKQETKETEVFYEYLLKNNSDTSY